MELAKLIIGVLTPLTVAVVGYFLNQRLKAIDNAQWQNRKIIEKRLEIFDKIAPDLNKVYCFCTFLGYWKEISPQDVLKVKRELDKQVYIYGHLLTSNFFTKYDEFIHLAFQTYTGRGEDAKIRAPISSGVADRRIHANYEWNATFETMFSNEPLKTKEFASAYKATMEEFRKCIGLDAN